MPFASLAKVYSTPYLFIYVDSSLSSCVKLYVDMTLLMHGQRALEDIIPRPIQMAKTMNLPSTLS